MMQEGKKADANRETAGTSEVRGHVGKEKRGMRFYVTLLP